MVLIGDILHRKEGMHSDIACHLHRPFFFSSFTH